MSSEAEKKSAGSIEANFDGLVGPTHNYAGLAHGNVASAHHAGQTANPQLAALQGLQKMRFLAEVGLPQGLIPPQERPYLPGLRRHGFRGSDKAILAAAHSKAPALLAQHCSASSMWAANAATVSPSADTADGKLHFTPANLVSHPHRALECAQTTHTLRTIFANSEFFCVHDPLPKQPEFADEGAANVMRLGGEDDDAGVSVFVFGRSEEAAIGRQRRAACEKISLQHQLAQSSCVFSAQSPEAIDAGAFHNDVVAVSHRNVLIFHEHAFENETQVRAQVSEAAANSGSVSFQKVAANELSLSEAVSSYLFNSQLVDDKRSGEMLLLCAQEVQACDGSRRLVERWIEDPSVPIARVQYMDLRQSMQNGGGPACLRLRVQLTPSERAAVRSSVWWSPELGNALEKLIHRFYRDRLAPDELADPALLDESLTFLDRLTQLLELGSFYEFQR